MSRRYRYAIQFVRSQSFRYTNRDKMPKKPEADVARTKIAAVRFTAAEHAAYTAAAAKDGLGLSSWLRWLAEQQVVAQTRKRK